MNLRIQKRPSKMQKEFLQGGGNTFVLVDQLYKIDVIDELKTAIESGTPYRWYQCRK